MLGDNKIKMSKRLSFSSSIRLRSIRYRINSHRIEAEDMSLTIDKSDRERERQTPHFLLDSRINIHKVNSVRFGKSRTCRKPVSVDLETGSNKEEANSIDWKIDSARTLETFMDRDGNEAWKNKSRVKLPLIDSNPQMSFIPVPIQCNLLQTQLKSCQQLSIANRQQLDQLKQQISSLSRFEPMINRISQQLTSNLSQLKRGLTQSKLKHFQFIQIMKCLTQKEERDTKKFHSLIQQSIERTKQIQNVVFNSRFEVELEPQYTPQL